MRSAFASAIAGPPRQPWGDSPVRVRARPEILVTVGEYGALWLYNEQTAVEYQCEPAAAAMWLMLIQNAGDSGAAATTLARIWDTEPAYVRAAMELLIEELCAAGMLSIEI